MTLSLKIVFAVSMVLMTMYDLSGQPTWVTGTPSIGSTGALSITLNYGLERTTGTVYVIVYNYNNTSILSSNFVRNRAQEGPAGDVVATAVITVRRSDIGRILQYVLNVRDPQQVHTVYVVAADSRRILQNTPVRLTATTLPCPQADAGTGGDACSLSFSLNAVPKIGQGTWARISGPGQATFSPSNHEPDAVVTVTAYGTYTFRWTEISGICQSSDDIVVNFIPGSEADAGNGGNECDLNFQLQAVPPSVPGTGTWTMTSGTGTAAFGPNPNTPSALVTVTEYGTKIFTWTVVNGQCESSDNVTVNFYQQPVAEAGQGGNNCGLELYLNAVPSIGTGTWTRISGPGSASFSPDQHAPDALVRVSQYGEYVFRWTEVNGACSSSETLTIGFHEFVSANAGNGGNECDLNFRLNAVPGTGTGTWSMVNGPGTATFSPNANQYNAVVTVTQYGAYDFAWTEVSFNCSSTDIIRVVFHSAPSVNAGQDDAVCKGRNIQLHATGSGTFLWSPAGLLNNPAIPEPVATPVVTTIYTVTLTDEWNCTNSDQVRIEVMEQPVSDAGPDQILEYLFETTLNAGELMPYDAGEWSVITGTAVFDDINNNGTGVTGLSLGENQLVWSVSNAACSESSDTVVITVNELIVPTMITPNLDGKNDFFIIKGLESLGRTDLRVFNRWGGIVYHNENYANNWDGKDYQGDDLPDDTYFFIIKTEKTSPIKGYVLIRR